MARAYDSSLLNPLMYRAQRSHSPTPSIESSTSLDSERYDSDLTDYHTNPSLASSRTDLSDAGHEDHTFTFDAEKEPANGEAGPPALAVEPLTEHLSNCRKYIATRLSNLLHVDYLLVLAKILYSKRGANFILPLRALFDFNSDDFDLGAIESRILVGVRPSFRQDSIQVLTCI